MTLVTVALAMTVGRARLAGPARVPTGPSAAARAVPRALVLLAIGSLAAALWAWLDAHQFVLAMLLGLVVAGAWVGSLRRRRAARAADRTADQVLALCDAMASDLAAGQPPLASLGPRRRRVARVRPGGGGRADGGRRAQPAARAREPAGRRASCGRSPPRGRSPTRPAPGSPLRSGRQRRPSVPNGAPLAWSLPSWPRPTPPPGCSRCCPWACCCSVPASAATRWGS